MRILLVEDEKALSKNIAKGLKNKGYAVDMVFDGEEAFYNYEVNDYDLIVLDLNIPKIDGIEVLRKIRKTDNDIKIIILSARSEISDRILGLDEGANDYLIKPFDFLELEARIRSLLLRKFTQAHVEICFGNLEIDTKGKIVHLNGEQIKLTKKEYGILEYLALHKNEVISVEELTEHVWDNKYDPFSNTFRYHISILKKKLSSKCDRTYIKTVHRQGYVMEGFNE